MKPPIGNNYIAETGPIDIGSDTNWIVNLPVGPSGKEGMGRRRMELRRVDLSPQTIARFRRKIQITESCWLWTGTAVRDGYGQVYAFKDERGRNVRFYAHRVAFAIAHGYVPASREVMHSCDNPSCVNPDHLSLGTHADNMADSAAKGRRAKVKPTIRKISVEGVIEIRQSTEPAAVFAKRWGVCVSHINRIRRGEKRKAD